MNIEKELQEALRRTEPPAGFADRVVRRLHEKPRRVLPRALAAAALIAFVLGGLGVHAAVRARNEVLTAMRIASHKVADAERAVNRR